MPALSDTLQAAIEANWDWSLTGDLTKAKAFAAALRAILLTRPQRVTIGQSTVEFGDASKALAYADAFIAGRAGGRVRYLSTARFRE